VPAPNTKRALLADALASTLSQNAAGHLRRAGIRRVEEHSLPRETLRRDLLLAGLPVYDALLDLEERAGGAAFPGSRMLGASCFLHASRDLPRVDGDLLFPIFGNPDHREDWETPFTMLGPSGALYLFDAPRGPALAYASLELFLEVEALAPLTGQLHTLRVDGYCGELLAGLVDATPHAAASGETVIAFAGDGVWVKQVDIALDPLADDWSSHRGTFLLTERLEPLVLAATLLLEAGHALGHRGPVGHAPAGAEKILSFVDAHPELGHRAEVEVTFWRGPDGIAVSHRCGR